MISSILLQIISFLFELFFRLFIFFCGRILVELLNIDFRNYLMAKTFSTFILLIRSFWVKNILIALYWLINYRWLTTYAWELFLHTLHILTIIIFLSEWNLRVKSVLERWVFIWRNFSVFWTRCMMNANDLFNRILLRIPFIDVHRRVTEGAALALTHGVINDQATSMSKDTILISLEGMRRWWSSHCMKCRLIM